MLFFLYTYLKSYDSKIHIFANVQWELSSERGVQNQSSQLWNRICLLKQKRSDQKLHTGLLLLERNCISQEFNGTVIHAENVQRWESFHMQFKLFFSTFFFFFPKVKNVSNTFQDSLHYSVLFWVKLRLVWILPYQRELDGEVQHCSS